MQTNTLTTHSEGKRRQLHGEKKHGVGISNTKNQSAGPLFIFDIDVPH